MGAEKLKELRDKAFRAERAVREEEDRQRQEYNDALTELHEQVERHLADAGWVVELSTRKHEQCIETWPDEDVPHRLKLWFAFSGENTPDLYEDETAKSVELAWLPVGETCRFNCPPPWSVLEATLGAYMALAVAPA